MTLRQSLRMEMIDENKSNQLSHRDNLISDTDYIYELILNLPLGYRTVFNLFAIEGYSHKEIAETLNISVGTSKSQLSKAKKALRQKLEILFD